MFGDATWRKKKYKCNYCRKKFKTELFLKKHIKVLHNHGGKNYDCDECGKDFGTAQYLRKHVEIVHEGRRDYNCNKCGKDFSYAHVLKTHIESVHEGRRDYRCSGCGKDFSTAQYLKKHIQLVHEGQRNHHCGECGKDFSTAQYLKTHIECIHKGLKDYNCSECGKKFGQSSNLRSHIEHVHEKRRASKLIVSVAAVDEDNSEIDHKSTNVQIPRVNNAPIMTCENVKVKEEQFDTEELPAFESESTYLDNNIKNEIKIEPLENINDGQMLKDPNTRRKSKQEENTSNFQKFSSIHVKSEEQNENIVPKIKIKKEDIEFEEMPIFEKDSAYLDETIKKEIKTEPYH